MSNKKNTSDEDIEIIDFDLKDIEDRINAELEDNQIEEIKLMEGINREDDLPIISDPYEYTDSLSNKKYKSQEIAEELPELMSKENKVKNDLVPKLEEEEVDIKEKKKTKKKKTASDYVRGFAMIIAVCVLVYAGYQLAMIYMEYKEADDEYNKLENLVEKNSDITYNIGFDSGDPFDPSFTPKQIDWQSLIEINGDVYGWIQFESQDLRDQIDYPILQGSDNSYYLNHTINGTENASGSIFMDSGNDAFFSDMNTFVYGHNMKNNSMFGLLRNYKKAEYYSGHEYFWIYTPDGRYRYKIFTCYEPLTESETYKWWGAPCDENTQYMATAKASSLYDTGVSVAGDDHVVTLSTCTNRGDKYRFIVQAKLIHSEVK